MSLIEFDNVSYSYPGAEESVPALKNLSMKIEEGDFVALVGHNGSGKSTAAKLMNGLILPEEGKVTVNGLDTADKNNLFDIRKTVGVVFQNPDNQMVATIIEDDIAFGPENLGVAPEEISRRVDEALELVGMTGHRKGTPFRLSGGQKQRIAIAGILAIKPRVLVLDESTAMLDPIGRAEVMRVIKDLHEKEKITIVLITHFMEEAAKADKIFVLNEGKLLFSGGKEIFLRGGELADIGLSVPNALKIAEKLKAGGLDLGDSILDAEGLVDALCR